MGIDVQPIYEDYQKRKSYNFATYVPPLEKLSVIIITKNEEHNIGRCLQSVQFADEVVIVDSGSQDRTLEIAAQFSNVKIIQTQWFGFVENKRIAVKNASYDWIFWIDADEEAPAALGEEWKKIIHLPLFHEFGAIDVARKTFFMQTWIQHSGWYPNRVIRFFRKQCADFNDNILHEGVEVKKGYRIENFKTDLLHYSYTSLYQYFLKMNQYGAAGAQQVIRKNKLVTPAHLFLQPLWTFIRFYILKRGFLDGTPGLIVCMGAAFSNFIKYTNYFYLKRFGAVSEPLSPSETISSKNKKIEV